MKDAFWYAAFLLAFICVSFVLSWLAVYAFWFAAFAFQSVPILRVCEFVGSFILIPVRLLFWAFGDFFDQTAPLTDPTSYAAVNGVLLGSLTYSCCRRFLFGKRTDGSNAQS